MKIKCVFIFLLVAHLAVAQAPKREFRGVWVATVNNVDWPSKPGLTVEQQKQEIREILDMHKANGMNAIIFQARPAGDTFFPSQYEPWSQYLTGVPGKAPDPYYDPLQEWIDRTHERGMEFHAWCNPYRVSQNAGKPLAGNHVAFSHPEWILKYGNKLYFDPGNPEVRAFLVKVITDMVSRYDVDAIHFDDYFYPYKIAGEEFPDEPSFRLYNTQGFADRDDWRRNNVDLVIQMLSESVKKTKPWVKFGISPFGVWRNQVDDPRGSPTSAGTTNYDHLYADILKWQEQNWIDYVAPQLYWQIGHPAVDFKILCDWWAANSYGKNVYIGQAPYRIDPGSTVEAWAKGGEIGRQISYLRQNPKVSGSIYFSSKSFKADLFGLKEELRNNYYRYPALVPVMPWIDRQAPETPRLKKSGRTSLKWKNKRSKDEMGKAVWAVIYINKKGEVFNPDESLLIFDIVPGNKYKLVSNPVKKQKYEVRVSALDRNNNESKPSKPVIVKL
ncbi:MAG: family 10 glycosylhydrolase [Prolixibacteraceae bacterium]|jgi:uncharacterized lipoprotein YddW (UPF0748 family)|nr:family 10 glycosylhydrolase [Prolixibacteraceae bacterium]